MSTEASVNLLQESSQQSYILFCLLGCLPDGIKKEHLISLWTDEEGIEKSLKTLEKLSFLEEGLENKVQLTSILIDYMQQSFDQESKQIFMEKVCEYYFEFLNELFKVNGAVDFNS